MKNIVTFLMFNNQAEEAVNFYVSVFSAANKSGKTGKLSDGIFHLNGHEFYAMNGGPTFSFGQGMSLFVNCDTQEEIDELWEKLSAGGEKSRCGWLKDKFGISWQIVPSILGELLHTKNTPEKSKKVMEAMLKMDKLDIKTLRLAAE